jgi:hypothetical protein
MRRTPLFGLLTWISLTSCATTYQGATINGNPKDVTRADITAAVEAVRAEPQLKRANNKLHEIDVSPNEIDLLWDLGEKDVVKRVCGRWQYIITYIVVGRQRV